MQNMEDAFMFLINDYTLVPILTSHFVGLFLINQGVNVNITVKRIN